jgi:hypothetical protein
VRAIKRLLKHAGRYLGLRAIEVREDRTPAASDANAQLPAPTATGE